MPAVAQVHATPSSAFRTQTRPPAGSRNAYLNESNRHLRESLSTAGATDDMALMKDVAYSQRRLRRGETLFNPGDKFTAIYVIRRGFFKTCVVDHAGREQVSGFFMSGDSLGLDGLGVGCHNGAAVALEDSEVYVLPFVAIEEVLRENPSLQHHLHVVLAREIARDHGVMMLLGSLRAAERLATFLINLSKRFARRGYSSSDFHLRMTREDIGSYLGLKLETVSRLFSGFAKDGLVEVKQKHVRILNIAGLERVLEAGN